MSFSPDYYYRLAKSYLGDSYSTSTIESLVSVFLYYAEVQAQLEGLETINNSVFTWDLYTSVDYSYPNVDVTDAWDRVYRINRIELWKDATTPEEDAVLTQISLQDMWECQHKQNIGAVNSRPRHWCYYGTTQLPSGSQTGEQGYLKFYVYPQPTSGYSGYKLKVNANLLPAEYSTPLSGETMGEAGSVAQKAVAEQLMRYMALLAREPDAYIVARAEFSRHIARTKKMLRMYAQRGLARGSHDG